MSSVVSPRHHCSTHHYYILNDDKRKIDPVLVRIGQLESFLETKQYNTDSLYRRQLRQITNDTANMPTLKPTPPIPVPSSVSSQLIGVIEVLFMALFDGGLVVMGITCIFLLTSTACKLTAHRKFWQAYIAVLMFLNVSALLETFLQTFSWAIYNSNPKKHGEMTFITLYMSALTAVLMVVFTDGVLVGRQMIL